MNAASPNDRPIGIDANMVYNPLQIRMDNNIANTLVDRDFGYGNGIVPLRFKDDDRFKGEYTLYLSFERVNDPTQIAAPLGQWDANFARNQRWFIEKY